MHRAIALITGILALALATGCATVGTATTALVPLGDSRGIHAIPTTRDYQNLGPGDIAQAEAALLRARRVGARHSAAYEHELAALLLDEARRQRSEGDSAGEQDYSALARDFAERAARKGFLPDPGPWQLPKDEQACREMFENLRARYLDLDRDKAAQVSPVIYASVTAALSVAEHELQQGRRWQAAARALETVGSDIDTILAQDIDGDTIPDMFDGAPWAPEDFDGFEDEDGIPDPDNDQDGVLDENDLTPNEPETKNRYHDHDGVPDAYPAFESILFPEASATLSAEYMGYLRGVLMLLNEWPELRLHIAGHTDNRHSSPYSLDLSQRRAEEVRRYLLRVGCPEERLVVTFHGHTQPVADNATTEGRAMNRRVDLRFQ
jgi:outer membrane protein OmpA-like peptidoglycan-associated protein